MNSSLEYLVRMAIVGMGATAVLDLWLLLLKARNIPTLDFALLGRWIGHLLRGRWRHEAIGRATVIRGERALGWVAHYAIGIGFAVLLACMVGFRWLDAPTLMPALIWGMATVAFPLLVMQPSMGAGFASSRTKTPVRNCLKSVINHAVFGLGLYGAARLAFLMAWN